MSMHFDGGADNSVCKPIECRARFLNPPFHGGPRVSSPALLASLGVLGALAVNLPVLIDAKLVQLPVTGFAGKWCMEKAILSGSVSRTHDVLNQPSPLCNYNPFEIDRTLVEAVRREGAGWAEPELAAFGARVGSEEVIGWGFLANENPPVLRTHDRFGHRIDEVAFHPAWHELMRLSMGAGLAGRPWREKREGAHVARAACYMLACQNEQGHCCPVTMTYAAVPVLQGESEIATEWLPKITADGYNPR